MTARAAVLVAALAAPCGATEVVALPQPGALGWRPLTFPKVARRTVYTVVEEDGVRALRADSDCAASAVALPLDKVDLLSTPRLRWRWKVERPLKVANERVKAGDDFAARVYVTFRFDPRTASFSARVRHRIARALFGAELPGHAVNYVRSSTEPAGAVWDNPFAAESKTVSLGPGQVGAWATEEVDVAADYRRLIGGDPPPLMALAVMTDADNTCQHAVAYFADFTFLPARGPDQEGE